MDYEHDMYIDEDALELEFLEQPRLMLKYTKHLAELRRERDQLKEALDLVDAELDKSIRDNPSDYGLEKITEGAVRNATIAASRHRRAAKAFIDASFEVNVAQGVVSSLEQRKTALENLVRLHGQAYFAGPRVPHDITQLRDERSKQINAGINKHLKRTKHG